MEVVHEVSVDKKVESHEVFKAVDSSHKISKKTSYRDSRKERKVSYSKKSFGYEESCLQEE